MTQRIYSPVERRFRDADTLRQLPAIDGLVPTRFDLGPWFVHQPWTNESQLLEDLPPIKRGQLRFLIRKTELRESLIRRLESARATGEEPGLTEDAADERLELAFGSSSDAAALRFAVSEALRAGFSRSEVAFAVREMDDAAALIEPLEAIEIISVSELVGGVRAE